MGAAGWDQGRGTDVEDEWEAEDEIEGSGARILSSESDSAFPCL